MAELLGCENLITHSNIFHSTSHNRPTKTFWKPTSRNMYNKAVWFKAPGCGKQALHTSIHHPGLTPTNWGGLDLSTAGERWRRLTLSGYKRLRGQILKADFITDVSTKTISTRGLFRCCFLPRIGLFFHAVSQNTHTQTSAHLPVCKTFSKPVLCSPLIHPAAPAPCIISGFQGEERLRPSIHRWSITSSQPPATRQTDGASRSRSADWARWIQNWCALSSRSKIEKHNRLFTVKSTLKKISYQASSGFIP